MRLLIGGSSSKFIHLKEFGDAISKFGVEYKLVNDVDIIDGFPSRKISNWFQSTSQFKKIINDFKPDAIFVDRQRHFGIAAIKSNLPVIMHLRGDFWEEIEWAKNTVYKSFPKNIVIKKWEKLVENMKCNGIGLIMSDVENNDISSIASGTTNNDYKRRGIISKGAILETKEGKCKVVSRPGQTGKLRVAKVCGFISGLTVPRK